MLRWKVAVVSPTVTLTHLFSRALRHSHVLIGSPLYCYDLCDWLELLFWCWFYDTQLKTALTYGCVCLMLSYIKLFKKKIKIRREGQCNSCKTVLWGVSNALKSYSHLLTDMSFRCPFLFFSLLLGLWFDLFYSPAWDHSQAGASWRTNGTRRPGS